MISREEFNKWLISQEIKSSYKIDYIYKNLDIGDGWLPLVKDLIEKIIDAGWDRNLSQIKEKYGSLCFYIYSSSDEVFDIIEEFEEKSSKICEKCGAPGEIVKINGWYTATCKTHNK